MRSAKKNTRKVILNDRTRFYQNFYQSIYELIVETSTNLPHDVRRALQEALLNEEEGTQASLALRMIALNIDLAYERKSPICQDTGMPTFWVKVPSGADIQQLHREIDRAVRTATKNGILRPNAVHPLSGKNSTTNLGEGCPIVHWEQWEKKDIEVRLLLKGGGCENKSIQYSLPCELPHIGFADRTLDGVKKCILHAVWQAQGQGCSVGFLGVTVGGDRTSGYEHAKRQLLRKIDDRNPDEQLAELENLIVKQANSLLIGTMGFGGRATLLGCKIGVLHRLPASYFVSVSYNCWAFRRLGVVLDTDTGTIKRWLYNHSQTLQRMSKGEVLFRTGKEKSVTVPLTEEQVRQFEVGDVLFLTGVLHMGRDALHRYLVANASPVDLQGGAIYHCGPVALLKKDGWEITAAGPTTSMRQEAYQADVIRKHGVRMIIGKGGMGEKTLRALKEFGAVYCSAIGGAAQYYARCITKVEGVDLLEFGVPEAMWHVQVKDFPVIVTMDAHGKSLHDDIEHRSALHLAQLK